jgi:hypothetical protein
MFGSSEKGLLAAGASIMRSGPVWEDNKVTTRNKLQRVVESALLHHRPKGV